ncbi:helix-turn-helix domain-containing protein, partial [Scytonema hofmannii FACHB-248]|nr:helix-turn-helix domain-containing protein [Scytonema hofmannii FACHB-248]
MNKQSAADFLGVSVRALERYVQQGRIGVKYEKGKTRPTANFDQTELEAFKEELNQPTVKPAFESRQIATEQQPQTGKLVHQAGEIAEFGEIGVIDKLSSIIEVIGSTANLWLLTLTCIGDGHDGIWNIVREFKPEQERREIQDLF